jgi:antibiotic biosynthesis monooxygenase (ABM) superfamily enzyme
MAKPYGTVMIGRLVVPFEQLLASQESWRARNVPGFISESALLADDGKTVVMTVVFDSKESYDKLADDPAQNTWWETVARPMLEEDPQWIDGSWGVLSGQ